MTHILERAIIHFAAACFATLAVYNLYRYWLRRNRRVELWLSPDKYHLLVVSALTVFALATLREPVDVYFGQTVTKAITDFISWLAGGGVAVWGLYRFSKE
jgi:hypothetical protein